MPRKGLNTSHIRHRTNARALSGHRHDLRKIGSREANLESSKIRACGCLSSSGAARRRTSPLQRPTVNCDRIKGVPAAGYHCARATWRQGHLQQLPREADLGHQRPRSVHLQLEPQLQDEGVQASQSHVLGAGDQEGSRGGQIAPPRQGCAASEGLSRLLPPARAAHGAE